MRHADEIKKGLECCEKGNACRTRCPYDGWRSGMEECTSELAADALALIQQLQEKNDAMHAEIARLQAERDAAVEDMPTSCILCKHFQKKYNTCNSKKPCDRIGGVRTEWQWRGVQKEDSDA